MSNSELVRANLRRLIDRDADGDEAQWAANAEITDTTIRRILKDGFKILDTYGAHVEANGGQRHELLYGPGEAPPLGEADAILRSMDANDREFALLFLRHLAGRQGPSIPADLAPLLAAMGDLPEGIERSVTIASMVASANAAAKLSD